MEKFKIKKVLKYTLLIFFGLIILVIFLWALKVGIQGKIYGYRQVDATKSKSLYEKFIKSNIQKDIYYLVSYAKKNEYLEIYNYKDSIDIYMWYIINKDIKIKDIIVKKGFHGKQIKTYSSTYEQRTFGTDPLFCFYHLLKFEFKDRILIKYNEFQDIISEFQTENYYMVNCYFGQLAIGSSYKNSEIMMEVFGKPKSNLAVFNGKGKILVVLAVAHSGLPEIRDNYLKEILKPRLFEKGLN